MAKTKKGSSEKGKEKKSRYYPKAKHKYHISKLTKHLHTLGVDVSDHLETLGIEEDKLEKLEREEESFISKDDAEKLNEYLHGLMSASEKLVKLEAKLYKNSRPLVDKSFGKIAPFPQKLTTLHGIKSIFKKRDSEETIKEAHRYLLASFANEEKMLEEYKNLMDKIESATSNLVELEKKWKGKGAQARLDLIRINKTIRDMLHGDVYNLSNEIYELYNIRLKAYEHLIEVDKKKEERTIPELEQEYYKTAVVQGHYQKQFSEHVKKITKIYQEGVMMEKW